MKNEEKPEEHNTGTLVLPSPFAIPFGAFTVELDTKECWPPQIVLRHGDGMIRFHTGEMQHIEAAIREARRQITTMGGGGAADLLAEMGPRD